MPTREEYRAALGTIREYVPRVGDEVGDTAEGETDDGHPLEVIRCYHGGHVYDVLAVWDGSLAYFTLRYPYDALALFARQQALEEYDGPVPEGTELEVDVEAAEDELDRLAAEYPEEYAALLDRLRATIASPHTSYSVVTTDNGAVAQFYVDRKLFVYEDEFRVSTLGYSVQMVVSKGLEGRLLLEDAYGISERLWTATGDDTAQEPGPDPIRYIG